MAGRHRGDWWGRGAPVTEGSSGDIGQTQIATSGVALAELDATVKAYIPGTATILVSSHSSDDEYQVLVSLYDVAGNAWSRRQHVRVYISGTTGDAGSTVASTAPASMNVKSSASTDVFSWTSTIGTGVPATTNTAACDLEFITTSDGLLSLAIVENGANASTHVVTLDWIGGCVRSSGNIGTTVAAT